MKFSAAFNFLLIASLVMRQSARVLPSRKGPNSPSRACN